MNENQAEYIYKITTVEIWQKSLQLGILEGMPIDINDGYIHFSTKEQLAQTLSLHFKGHGELVIFAVNTKNIAENLKWEVSRGGALFPHFYDKLKMNMVEFFRVLEVDDNGETDLGWLK